MTSFHSFEEHKALRKWLNELFKDAHINYILVRKICYALGDILFACSAENMERFIYNLS
jgi:hypothetical protein